MAAAWPAPLAPSLNTCRACSFLAGTPPGTRSGGLRFAQPYGPRVSGCGPACASLGRRVVMPASWGPKGKTHQSPPCRRPVAKRLITLLRYEGPAGRRNEGGLPRWPGPGRDSSNVSRDMTSRRLLEGCPILPPHPLRSPIAEECRRQRERDRREQRRFADLECP
jgi:hypothetical protein